MVWNLKFRLSRGLDHSETDKERKNNMETATVFFIRDYHWTCCKYTKKKGHLQTSVSDVM